MYDSATPILIKMADGCADLMPKKAHKSDAGYDLYAAVDTIIPRYGSIAIPTGVFLELPAQFEAQVRSRSGMSLKLGACVTNSPGTIDSGFRGEICVIMHSVIHDSVTIKRGDRIAQLVINLLPEIFFVQATSLMDSDRGQNGFGSTGV